MNAMDPTLLKKFLAGDTNIQEAHLCEQYLSDPANRVQEDEVDSDSLIDTIRSVGTEANDTDVEELVEQIQKIGPRRAISQEDLKRVLSPPQAADELGRIGKYRVIEFIASGGMGLVFKAEDPELERLVCIKTLHPSLSFNNDAKARFAREAKSAAGLRNDRIVTVLDVGEHREGPYLVMQLLDGQSLRDKLAMEGKLSHHVAKKILLQIAEGLRYAHELGFLHRDIKPENIWITSQGDIKLLDFGLARAVNETTNLTATGTILGTPCYMSPEQVQGNELDARSDLFSVGSVLFEMLTGDSPFGKSNIFSTMMSVANESLELPNQADIPKELITVLQSLLKKSPNERIGSASELISALQANAPSTIALKQKSIELLSPTVPSAIPPAWTAALFALAGAAILAFGFLIFQANDKGTLVVEADPSIAVSIKNEEVSVHDPKTGKRFSVTIGDHPLPSGVYQLEMRDASGEYKLSSEVITIRRGEKEIVKVFLRPPSTMKMADENSIENGDLPNGILSANSKANSKVTLATLPTLDADTLRRKLDIRNGNLISRNATVHSPAVLNGNKDWSIEPVFNTRIKSSNANGELFASEMKSSDGFVRIWNREGQLLHLIPVQDNVRQVSWSPEPNVIAVVENGGQRKNVVIWKLTENHAQVIDVIPGEAQKIAWSSDGLILALQSKTDLTFYNLAEQKVFTHSNFGIRGSISDHPLSFDRRFLATTDTENKSVKIWDLRDKKLFHIFAGAEQNQFLPKGNRIAIRKADAWEIWDLDSFERTLLFDINPNWHSYAIDHRFETIAAVTGDRKLLVRNIITGTDATYEFTPDKGADQPWLGRIKLNWASDNQSLLCVALQAVFLVEVDSSQLNQGKLEISSQLVAHTIRGQSKKASELKASASNTGRIAWYTGHYLSKGVVACYDLNSQKHLPSTDFEFFDTSARFQISPNGKHMFVIGSSVSLPRNLNYTETGTPPTDQEIVDLRKHWSKDIRQIRIFDTDSGKKTDSYELVNNLINVQWTSDSSSLVISTAVTRRVEESDPAKIAAATKRYSKAAKAYMSKLDTDKNGELSLEEARASSNESLRRNPRLADLNLDGKITLSESIDAFGRLTDVYKETETNIYSIASKEKLTLSPKHSSKEFPDDLCFQRYSSREGPQSFASPKLIRSRVVLPLVNSSSYSFSGSRVHSRNGLVVEHKDKLGFFDLETGKLVEVVDLGEKFQLNRLEVSKHLIAIGRASDNRSSNIDSFFAFDRRDNNEAYVPPEGYERLAKGLPHVSPAYPYFAILSGVGPTVFHPNRDTKKLEIVQRLSKFKLNSGQTFAWHPTAPVCATIHTDQSISWFNVQTDVTVSNRSFSYPTDIIPTTNGWIILDSGKLTEFDMEFQPIKTHFSTDRFKDVNTTARLNQCITADGTILNPNNTENIRVIRLHEDRFETVKIEEAIKQ